MTKTVFVGLSGGVDSAVSAAILKESGYNVHCVFIKIWQSEFLECNWKEERIDAMRVATTLGLPYREIDLSDVYKKEVVDSMISGYAKGITPNPDVLCNRAIKFGSFLDYAMKNGADYIATGHYARINNYGGHFELLRGRDGAKDQSYFLHTLTQEDLSSSIFSIGHILKSEVRKLARGFRLPVANKADSQGLCFVGDITLKDFLKRYIRLQKGVVLNADGSVIGSHDGAALYTIGQRHGFSVTSDDSHIGPCFVTRIDVKQNLIWASHDLKDAERDDILVHDMHWISATPVLPAKFAVQARYRERSFEAHISINDSVLKIHFRNPHVVSPGQSLVIYDGEKCLGGGIISQ